MSFEDENDSHSHHVHMIALHQQQQREAQAWHEMQMMEVKTSMENFLDEMSPSQCIALSRMIQLFIGNPQYMHVVIGQLSMLMRRVHKICSMCGDEKHSTVDHLTADQAMGNMSDAPTDYGWLAGLSVQEQIRKLNMREDTTAAGAYICQNCESSFPTLFSRAQYGKDCPSCIADAMAHQNTPDNQLELGQLMFRYRVGESYTHEDGVFCLDCGTEFPVLKFRMEQGLECPTCKIQPEVQRDERPSESS